MLNLHSGHDTKIRSILVGLFLMHSGRSVMVFLIRKNTQPKSLESIGIALPAVEETAGLMETAVYKRCHYWKKVKMDWMLMDYSMEDSLSAASNVKKVWHVVHLMKKLMQLYYVLVD